MAAQVEVEKLLVFPNVCKAESELSVYLDYTAPVSLKGEHLWRLEYVLDVVRGEPVLDLGAALADKKPLHLAADSSGAGAAGPADGASFAVQNCTMRWMTPKLDLSGIPACSLGSVGVLRLLLELEGESSKEAAPAFTLQLCMQLTPHMDSFLRCILNPWEKKAAAAAGSGSAGSASAAAIASPMEVEGLEVEAHGSSSTRAHSHPSLNGGK